MWSIVICPIAYTNISIAMLLQKLVSYRTITTHMKSAHFSKHVGIINKECIKTDCVSTVNALKAYIKYI